MSKRGLEQISDPDALRPVLREILDNHADQVHQYLSGNTRMLGFFVGQVMKKTGGKANPGVVNALIKEQLDDLN